MFKKNLDTLVIATIFVVIVKLLGKIHFWYTIGLAEPSGLILQGLVFMALVIILRQTLFEPYINISEERYRQITEKRKIADERKIQAQDILKSYEQKILAARMDAIKQKEQIAMEAENEERKRLEVAKQKSQTDLDMAIKAILIEVEATKNELIKSTGMLVQQLVEEILSQKVSGKPGSSKSKTVETRM